MIGSYRFFRDMGYFVEPVLLGAVADGYGLDYAFYVTSVSLLAAMAVLHIPSKETLGTVVLEPQMLRIKKSRTRRKPTQIEQVYGD